MSGQLVGEVIAASATLRARGVKPRGFYALIAIAEKAGADRTASVRWDHIRAGLFEGSKRTAQRAVDDLLAAGIIRIVKVGFKNQRASRAPVYEILPLVDYDSQVSSSATEDHDSQVSSSGPVDDDKSKGGSRQNERGSRHPGVLLDVSFDGSFDRAAVRDAIDRCADCDAFGRLDNLQDCPLHPNFRTDRKPA